MKFHTYTSPEEVLINVEAFLLENEAENNLPLGLLYELCQSQNMYDSNQPFMVVGKTEKNETELFMLQTPPKNLVLTGKEQYVTEAVYWLKHNGYQIPSVCGMKSLVDKFVDVYEETFGTKAKVTMRQLLYRLDYLKEVPRSNGRLCIATEDDIALVTLWIQYFHNEVFSPIPKAEAADFVRKEIRKNRLFIWRNARGTPVSMAKRARGTKHGVAINFVYTPDEYKNQGYATACVATLTKRLLEEGYQFCTLYTDVTNTTSNNIYQKIGYKPICEAIQYSFPSSSLQIIGE